MVYNDEILDAPEIKRKKLDSFLFLGIFLGALINFMFWNLYVFSLDVFDAFGISLYIVGEVLYLFFLANLSTYLFLKIIKYKKVKTTLLFIFGMLMMFLGIFFFLIVLEKGDMWEVVDKPHVLGYPALSMLFGEFLILFAWICILKIKKKITGIIFLGLVLFWAFVNA